MFVKNHLARMSFCFATQLTISPFPFSNPCLCFFRVHMLTVITSGFTDTLFCFAMLKFRKSPSYNIMCFEVPLLISCLELGIHFSSKSQLSLVFIVLSPAYNLLTWHSTHSLSQAFAKCWWVENFCVHQVALYQCAVWVELFIPLTYFSCIICKVFACSSKHAL